MKKRIFAWLLTLIMVLGLIPASVIWADGEQPSGDPGQQGDGQGGQRSITIMFNGTKNEDGSYTFEEDGNKFTVTFIGGTAADGKWTVTDGDNDCKIAFDKDFDRDVYEVVLKSTVDDFSAKLTMTGDNEALVFGEGYNLQDVMELSFVKRNEDEPDHQGGGGKYTAVVNISGPEGSWELSPIVSEPYDVQNEDGSSSAPYSRYAFVADISINDGSRTNKMMHYNKDEDISGLETQKIGFDKGDADTTVTFTFTTNWGERIEEIIINNTNYKIPLDYDNRYDWLVAFGGQNISFDIDGVELPQPDKDGEYVFDVQLKVRPITENECFIGNFLWSKDDHFSPEGPDPSDLYIGHSSLILETVDFYNGKENVHWEINVEDDGTNREYTYEKDGVAYDYAHFSMKYPENDCSMGEMVIPEGAEVTMKIVPEYGYQVKSFSGVNFDAGNVMLKGGQCEFTFVVGKGNFHIGAQVEAQEDDAVSNSSVVTAGGVQVPKGIINSGSARLNISDPELSEEKKDEFTGVASDEGLEIKAVVNLDLKQVYFKGTGDDTQVWENDIDLKNLPEDENILVGLEIPEGIDEDDPICIIHNVDDGDEYEVIEPVGVEEGMCIFETRGFSNYAIALAAEDESEDDWERIDVRDDESGVEVSILAPDSADNYKLEIKDCLEDDDEEDFQNVKKAIGIPDEYELLKGYEINVVSSDPDSKEVYFGRKPIISIPVDDLTDKYENLKVLIITEDKDPDDDLDFSFEIITPTIENGMAVFEAETGASFVIIGTLTAAEENVEEPEEEPAEEPAKEADIEEPEVEEPAPEANTDVVPATGDSSVPGLMIILLLASAGVMITLVKKKED